MREGDGMAAWTGTGLQATDDADRTFGLSRPHDRWDAAHDGLQAGRHELRAMVDLGGDAGFAAPSFFEYRRPLAEVSGMAAPAATPTPTLQIEDYLRPVFPLEGGFLPSAVQAAVAGAGVSPNPLTAIDWGSRLADSVIDVWFAPQGGLIDGIADFGTAVAWTDSEQQQVMSVLDRIAAVTNLEYRVASDPTLAEFRLGLFQLDAFEAIAFMVPPGEAYAGFMGFDPDWLRALDGDSLRPMLSEGGFIHALLIEELLHGHGLAHAHDDGGTSTILQGVTAPVGSFGIGDLNQGVFTVMNYNEGWPAGPYGTAYQTDGAIVVNDFGYETTPMALDVAVLQAKYGADLGHALGDDVYTLPSVNGPGTGFECLWDAGGIDTLRHAGSSGAVIDLRQASLAGEAGGGGWVSYAKGVRGGYTIANGTVVENAVGGFGADRITGNGGANRLAGRDGSDFLDGRAGKDTLLGGAGDDTYTVERTDEVIVERPGEGRDTVLSSVSLTLGAELENLTLLGSAAIDGSGNPLANRLTGNAAANLLSGGGGSDTLGGGGGNDRLFGGSGADRMAGGIGADTYVVDHAGDVVVEVDAAGADLVRSAVDFSLGAFVENLLLTGTAAVSGTGNDLANVITGNAAANGLTGGLGADVLAGAGGDDVLEGGLGSDLLEGGNGSDLFVFRTAAEAGLGTTRDVIGDLQPADRIDLSLIDASTLEDGDQAFRFIADAAFSGVAGELRAVEGLIQGDLDGDGVADFEIGLLGTWVPAGDGFLL